MMGTKVRTFAPLPDDLSLEDLVPEDNFYRRLEARLDLSFIRELVAPLYASGGRPSVDPVVFFKLQLVMFFEDLRSERRLMGVVCEAKAWHGMRRFRLRTLWRVNVEALVTAAGQNIKRLLTFSGMGARRLAQVEALRPPAPLTSVNGRLLRGSHRRRSHRSPRVFQQAGVFCEVRTQIPTCKGPHRLRRSYPTS